MAQATLSVASGNSCRNGSRFAKVGEASAYLGCSASQVRLLMGSGELQGYVSDGGTRWVSWDSLLRYTGEDELESVGLGEGKGKALIALYLRVSSSGQERAGSLERQRERLIEEVCRREGVSASELLIYSDTASSFGDRPQLNKLVDSIIDGRIGKVYVEHQNRLSRVPALTRLLEHIAKRYGVELVALDVEELDPTSNAVMVQEILDFLTFYTNKQAAAKSRLVTVQNLTPEALERAVELKASGMNLTKVRDTLRKEGFKTDKGKRVSYHVLLKVFDNNGVQTAVSALVGKSPKLEAAPVEQFLRSHFQVLPEGSYDGKAVRVKTRDLYKAYSQFCKRSGFVVDSTGNFGLALKKVVPASRKLRTMGYTCWRGCRLVGLNSKGHTNGKKEGGC